VRCTKKADDVGCAVVAECFTPESDLDWFAKTLRESVVLAQHLSL
jgi:hypothetical protein